MSKDQNRLTALQVARAKPGHYHDGRGLYLVISSPTSRKWIYRFTWNHNPTEMGIGSAFTVTLKEARERAHNARLLVAQGINPITAKCEKRLAAVPKPSFGECALALIAAKQLEWRNVKHRSQWRTTLETYAAPPMAPARR
jgi:Arm DNA-binding domain